MENPQIASRDDQVLNIEKAMEKDTSPKVVAKESVILKVRTIHVISVYCFGYCYVRIIIDYFYGLFLVCP